LEPSSELTGLKKAWASGSEKPKAALSVESSLNSPSFSEKKKKKKNPRHDQDGKPAEAARHAGRWPGCCCVRCYAHFCCACLFFFLCFLLFRFSFSLVFVFIDWFFFCFFCFGEDVVRVEEVRVWVMWRLLDGHLASSLGCVLRFFLCRPSRVGVFS